MQLKDILLLPCFSGSHVIAGEKGLTNNVRVVNVMEVPDIFDWVMEDELLLTTAYPYKDNPETLVMLIERLHKKKLAGMAVKLNRFISSLPDAVLELADRLNFPLISLPAGAQFNRMLMETLSNIIQNDSFESKQASDCAKKLEQMALTGASLQAVVEELSFWCRGEITITSATGMILAHCRPEGFPATTAQGVFLEKPVILGGRHYAIVSLKLQEHPPDTTGAAMLNAAIPSILMILLHSYVEEQDKTREEQLHRLLLGQASVQLSGAEPILQPFELYTVCVIQPHGVKGEIDFQLYDVLNSTLLPFLPAHVGRPMTTRMPKGVVHIFSSEQVADKDEITKLYEALLIEMKEQYPDLPLCVGISRLSRPADQINLTYNEAQRACSIGKRLSHTKSGLFLYELLAEESILSHLEMDQEIEEFVNSELGKLIQYDRKNNKNLLETLEQLLSGSSTKEIAERMYIHPKTLVYRRGALEKIMGRSLSDTNNRFRIMLALKLYRLNSGLWLTA